MFSIKREIRHFSRRSRAKTARNVQKTWDAKANLLFCLILHLMFAFHCSRCRLIVGSKRGGRDVILRFDVRVTWTRMLDRKANGRSQWSLPSYRRFPFNQNFRKFGKAANSAEKCPETFPEIPEIVEFPKCESFNLKF